MLWDEPGRVWWRDGCCTRSIPRSYMDTNGDGVGDFAGHHTARLDHLQWLGGRRHLARPITTSPNKDLGLRRLRLLRRRPRARHARRRRGARYPRPQSAGFGMILDLVPNHSSDQHPWFPMRSRSRDSKHRDWYVWPIPSPTGRRPQHWWCCRSTHVFPRGPSTRPAVSTYHLTSSTFSTQPDLNWWNEDVRDAFDESCVSLVRPRRRRFRIDVCHSIIKDRDLRDNPPATKTTHWWVQMSGLRSVYNSSAAARGARRVEALLGVASPMAYDPPSRAASAIPTCSIPSTSARSTATTTSSISRSTSRCFTPSSTRPRYAPPSRRPSCTHLPANAWPVLDRREPRQPSLRVTMVRGRSGQIRAALVMLMACAERPSSTYGFDEIGMPDNRDPGEPSPRSGRRLPRRPMIGRDPGTYADAVDGASPAPVTQHRSRRRAVASLRRYRRWTRGRPTPRPRLDPLAHA